MSQITKDDLKLPKNDTYGLNEESDLNDQKQQKMTKSNKKLMKIIIGLWES